MTLPSDWDRGELRYLDRGTTFTQAFTAADNAAWDAGTAVKLRYFDLDFSGLTYESVKDNSTQTRFAGRNAILPLRRTGSFKFKMHLPGGMADTTADPAVTLLGHVMGGVEAPGAASDAAEASCTTTRLELTGHALKENQIVLCGEEDDAASDGKCAPVSDASESDYVLLGMALAVAPGTSDVIKFGTTLFVDESDESYLDFLFLGSHSGGSGSDDPDSIQCIGCSGKAVLGGFAPGETPFVEFEFMVGDWRWVNYDDQASFSHTSAAQGGDPVSNAEEGQLQIQDNGTTTRRTVCGGDIEFDLGFDLTPIQCKDANNGVGGWKKIRTENGPTLSVSAFWTNLSDMPGAYNDFTGGTAKHILYQIGSSSTNVMAVYLQNAYTQPIDPSTRIELEGNTAIRLTFEANSGNATLLASDDDRLEDAPLVISFN